MIKMINCQLSISCTYIRSVTTFGCVHMSVGVCLDSSCSLVT
jgi:hypothetical protein